MRTTSGWRSRSKRSRARVEQAHRERGDEVAVGGVGGLNSQSFEFLPRERHRVVPALVVELAAQRGVFARERVVGVTNLGEFLAHALEQRPKRRQRGDRIELVARGHLLPDGGGRVRAARRDGSLGARGLEIARQLLALGGRRARDVQVALCAGGKRGRLGERHHLCRGVVVATDGVHEAERPLVGGVLLALGGLAVALPPRRAFAGARPVPRAARERRRGRRLASPGRSPRAMRATRRSPTQARPRAASASERCATRVGAKPGGVGRQRRLDDGRSGLAHDRHGQRDDARDEHDARRARTRAAGSSRRRQLRTRCPAPTAASDSATGIVFDPAARTSGLRARPLPRHSPCSRRAASDCRAASSSVSDLALRPASRSRHPSTAARLSALSRASAGSELACARRSASSALVSAVAIASRRWRNPESSSSTAVSSGATARTRSSTSTIDERALRRRRSRRRRRLPDAPSARAPGPRSLSRVRSCSSTWSCASRSSRRSRSGAICSASSPRRACSPAYSAACASSAAMRSLRSRMRAA